MIADFVLKGIDNLFNQKLSLQPKKKLLTKQIFKQNIDKVIRKGNLQDNLKNQESKSPNIKSRLKYILEHNKQQKIRSVVKRGMGDRSSSPSPYTKIQKVPSMRNLKVSQSMCKQSTNETNNQKSVIQYYREQRKTIQKSRVSQNGSILMRNKSILSLKEDNEEQWSKNNQERKCKVFDKRQVQGMGRDVKMRSILGIVDFEQQKTGKCTNQQNGELISRGQRLDKSDKNVELRAEQIAINRKQGLLIKRGNLYQ